MTFNWPDIPFSGTEVDAFVAEYKIVAEELLYHLPYDSTILKPQFRNDDALKKFLEYGLVYAAFIVKQRAGNSGPGTDFDLGNSPYGPTDAMSTPEKRKHLMQNLGCVATMGAMINCWKDNKEKDPSLDPYDELGRGIGDPIGDLMDELNGFGSTDPDDPCEGFYAKYDDVKDEVHEQNEVLWSSILTLADSFLGSISPNGHVAVAFLRRYLQGTGGVVTENSDWGAKANRYKRVHKASIKEHINYWKNSDYVTDKTLNQTWKDANGVSATDKIYQVGFSRNFLLASAYGTATVVLSGDPTLGDFEVKRLIDDYDFFYGWEIVRSNTGIDIPGSAFNDLNVTSGLNRKTNGQTTGPCAPNSTVCQAISRQGFDYAMRLPVADAMGQGCWDKWEDHPSDNPGKPFAININFSNIPDP